MTAPIDYESTELPDNGQYEEWTYAQRRAYVLSEIRDVGHPKLLNQTEIAKQFDVDPSSIHNDIDVLAEYIDDTLGDRRVLTTDTVVQRSIQGLLEEGEYRKAAQTALEWSEWVAREGDLATMKEQLEALVEATQAGGESESENEVGGVELAFDDPEQ